MSNGAGQRLNLDQLRTASISYQSSSSAQSAGKTAEGKTFEELLASAVEELVDDKQQVKLDEAAAAAINPTTGVPHGQIGYNPNLVQNSNDNLNGFQKQQLDQIDFGG